MSESRSDSLGSELTRRRLRARKFGVTSAPQYVDRFRLVDDIGQSAMGTARLAWDERGEREVALGFVEGRGSTDELLRQAQSLVELTHPHVVTVLEAGVHEGRVWLAMEYVRGRTLRHVLAEVGEARDRSALLGHWLAVGRALAAVHAAGLVHRDVTPDNAVLGDDGRVRLIDLGLALGTGSAAAFERAASYAAPEQREGRRSDARADQHGFCACVWEALTSARPRRDAEKTLVLPRAAMLSPGLVRVLRRGLAERPEDRYACMGDLLAALERVVARRG